MFGLSVALMFVSVVNLLLQFFLTMWHFNNTWWWWWWWW